MRPFSRLICGIFLSVAVGIAASALIPANTAIKAVPKGNAAWMFPDTLENIENWKSHLTAYNQMAGAERAVRVIYVYSMDVYIGSIPNYKPVVGTLAMYAANTFRTIPYVTHVGAILDGYYDNTDYSDGNFNGPTTTELQTLADNYARLYCSACAFDGIALDLEPFSGAYRSSMLTFTRRLAQSLRDTTYCPTPAYGKFLGFFLGPQQANAEVYDAVGPNGFTIISGYDLYSPGPGLPESPTHYRANLLANIKLVKSNAAKAVITTGVTGRFSIGLPFAASACEFELGVNSNDPSKTIQGYPMYSPSQPSFIPAAFEVLNLTLGNGYEAFGNPYLGVTMWGFLTKDVKVAGYRHLPKNPFDTEGMMSYLASSMPRKLRR